MTLCIWYSPIVSNHISLFSFRIHLLVHFNAHDLHWINTHTKRQKNIVDMIEQPSSTVEICKRPVTADHSKSSKEREREMSTQTVNEQKSDKLTNCVHILINSNVTNDEPAEENMEKCHELQMPIAGPAQYTKYLVLVRHSVSSYCFCCCCCYRYILSSASS